MRRLGLVALATAAGLTMTTAAFAQSRDFDLEGFDRVDVSSGLGATVTIGDSFSVRAESRSQEALDKLEVDVDRGVLRARIESNFLDFIMGGGLVGMLLNSGNAVQFTITVPALAGADASGGADIHLAGLRNERIELNASSGANIDVTDATLGIVIANASSGSDIELDGRAQAIDANASSGGDIDAGDLVAVTAKANASSGSNISVNASQSISGQASSGGDIDVRGNPAQRDVGASSGGDVNFDD